MVNKKGWMKILEVFVAILLVTIVTIIVVEGEKIQKDNAEKIYQEETAILREIQLNESLREIVLNSPVPLEWEGFDSKLKSRILSMIPDYIECRAKICSITGECSLDLDKDAGIYSQQVMISSTLDFYYPKKVKIFCWEK